MTNRRYDLTWLMGALIFGFCLGLSVVTWVKSYPTEPADWNCETAPQLKDGYKLCRVREVS